MFSASSTSLGIYYLIAPANADKNITVTITNPSFFAKAFVAEFSGTATTSVFESDATASFQGPSVTINTPSITTVNNGDLIIAVTNGYDSIASADSPFSIIDVTQASSAAEYFVQSTSGAQAVAFTQASSAFWDAMSAAFKAGGTGDILASQIWL